MFINYQHKLNLETESGVKKANAVTVIKDIRPNDPSKYCKSFPHFKEKFYHLYIKIFRYC